MIRNLFFWQNLYFNSHINSNNRILIQTNSDHVKAYGSRIVKFICLNLHFRLFQKSFMEGFLKVNWRCSNTTYRQARFVLHFFSISSLKFLHWGICHLVYLQPFFVSFLNSVPVHQDYHRQCLKSLIQYQTIRLSFFPSS